MKRFFTNWPVALMLLAWTWSLVFLTGIGLAATGPEINIQRKDGGSVVLDWNTNATTGVLQRSGSVAGPWTTLFSANPPYEVKADLSRQFFRLGPGRVILPNLNPNEMFFARGESEMGVWSYLPNSPWMFTRGNTWSRIRSGRRDTNPRFRSMSGSFVVAEDRTPVAVFFSAETYVVGVNKRLFVRALVDRQALAPSNVVFAEGTSPVSQETRAFVFTGTLDAGVHTVEMEWLVDDGGTAYIRDGSFLVRLGDGDSTSNSLQVDTPVSGPSISTDSTAWQNVPGLSDIIQTKAGESLIISVGAESHVTGGDRLFLRALVDGVAARPSDVLFATGPDRNSRLFTFGLTNPAAGAHTVTVQWRVANGTGIAYLGDRSLVLAATPKADDELSQVIVIPPSSPSPTTTSQFWAPIPGLSVSGALPHNAEVAVLFSALTVTPANDAIRVRLVINDTPVPEAEIHLAAGSLHTGAHSFVFSAKHLVPPRGASSSTIRLEWRSDNGGSVTLDDRTMTVLVKPATIPDLCEPKNWGGNNWPIEAAIGPRKVLPILFDPNRTNHPALNNLGKIRDTLFDATHSVKHYFSVNSGGKFTLESAGGGTNVLGWYAGWWDSSSYFGGGAGCDDGGSANGADRRREEAVFRAAQALDLTAFDLNKDGVLDPQTELAVLIILPETEDGMRGYVRSAYDADCGPLTVDGLIIPMVAEVFTDFNGDEFIGIAHELAHLICGLDDMYVATDVHTSPRRLSLMDAVGGAEFTPHIDAANKLALGWVAPRVITADGAYSLRDVKKSQEVLVLPRLPGETSDEYYLLENRQNGVTGTLYDKDIIDSGIAVWHIIESHVENGQPPPCLSAVEWGAVNNGNARRGIRLVRPSVITDNARSLWHASEYDLLDDNLICPGPNPFTLRRNALIWADGTASGYNLLNWSAAMETMTFDVVVP